MRGFIPTFLIDRLIEERSLVARTLEEERMQDIAERIRDEVRRLEELKGEAERLNGPVPEVAAMFGYSPGHVYALIREGTIENVATNGEEIRVRYMDVLSHRMNDVLEVGPRVNAPKRNGRSTQRKGALVKITRVD